MARVKVAPLKGSQLKDAQLKDNRVKQFDLATLSVRDVNQFLHCELPGSDIQRIEIANPSGLHSIAAGLDCQVQVEIQGHAGYFIAGMNKQAHVIVHGNVGWSVAERYYRSLLPSPPRKNIITFQSQRSRSNR